MLKIPVFPSPHHDHQHCVAVALETAADRCARRGVRLTPVRRQVLERVWASHVPIGAYEILDMLRRSGRTAAPPTVYRALDFLLAQGLVHRIERLNAFVGCSRPQGDPLGRDHAGQFLICSRCHATAEVDDPVLAEAVDRAASAAGFAVTHPVIEIAGLCAHCRGEAGRDD